MAPVASSSAREVSTGVRWATPSIRRAAAWTSSSEIIGTAGWRTSRRRRGAPPARARARANAATTSSTSPASSPEAISRSGGRSITRGDLEQQRPHEVGEHGRRPRAGRAAQIAARRPSTRDAVRPAAASVAATDSRSWSQASTGSKPSRAAATARIPEPQPQSASGPPGGSADQQLERQPRARVRAGAERLPGIDHHVERARPLRRPRRAHAQRPDVERPVPVAPVRAVGDLGGRDVDQRAAGRPPAARRCRAARRARRRARTRPCPSSTSRSSSPPGTSSSSSASTGSACARATRTASRIMRAPPPPSRPPRAAARSRSAERGGDLVGLVGEHARRRCSARRGGRVDRATSSSSGRGRLATTVGAHGAAVAQVVRPRLDRDAVARGVRADHLDRRRVDLDRRDRRPAEPRRGDRQHAGPGAPVAQRAAGRLVAAAARRHSRVVACVPAPK